MTVPYVAKFVGGPLDGREEILDDLAEGPKQTITHIYLHDGPKIEHHYDLYSADRFGWEYRLRETG